MNTFPNSPMGMLIKVQNLTMLNLRYEGIDFDHELQSHPYMLLANLLEQQINILESYKGILFAEGNKDSNPYKDKPQDLEEKHQNLYNLLWNKKTEEKLKDQIGRFAHRLKINDLLDFVKGKTCLDLGCGNGSFSFALIDAGAKYVHGIDYGEDSIKFAMSICKTKKLESNCTFQVGNVYKLPFEDDKFDFVIQNGVFHHLKDENSAIEEATRVLKAGGDFWYYTEGEGALRNELFEMSMQLLSNVPNDYMRKVLLDMNINENKTHHLMDCMNATCRVTSRKEITDRLKSYGYIDFKPLKGGFPWEFDQEVIQSDPYGKEKYGEGIIRILAHKGQ